MFEVLKYLLMMSGNASLTWSAHLRILFQLYKLPNPLSLLETLPWPKDKWKQHVKALVTSHHERKLRAKAASNYKLSFLNILATGLSGRLHPILAWQQTTQDVTLIRPHIKMLAGDYQCSAYLAQDRGTDPSCILCTNFLVDKVPEEDLVHVLTQCKATSDIRAKYFPELLNTVATSFPNHRILDCPPPTIMTQFLLDCTSLNLDNDTRIPANHPSFIQITRQCSVCIFSIHKDRCRRLKTSGIL